MKENTKVVDGHLSPRRHPTRRLAANTTAQENANAIVVRMETIKSSEPTRRSGTTCGSKTETTTSTW